MSVASIPLVCPTCQAKLRATDDMAGKAVPCPKCGGKVRVPGAPATRPSQGVRNDETNPSGSAFARSAGTDGAARNRRPFWRTRGEWTRWDLVLVRTGVLSIVFGVLSHILPLVGLQFRQLNQLGSAAPAAGTGVAVVGAFLILYVLVLKGRLGKLLLGLTAAGVVGIAVMAVIGYVSMNRRRHAPMPIIGPPGGPMGPGGAGWNGIPPRPSAPAPFGGAQAPAPQPPPDYDSLVARFGAGRVVRVTLSGIDRIDVHKAVKSRIDAWDTSVAGTKPTTWRVSTRSAQNEADVLLAPVDSLEGIVKALDLGSVTSMDAGERRIFIEIDATKSPGK